MQGASYDRCCAGGAVYCETIDLVIDLCTIVLYLLVYNLLHVSTLCHVLPARSSDCDTSSPYRKLMRSSKACLSRPNPG